MNLLEIRNLSKNFGGLAAISNLDFNVNQGDLLGLIGPNGAGKTTLFNLISGYYPPTHGDIMFEGINIAGLKADKITSMGISRTFQASTLFMQEIVFENILTGFHTNYKQAGWKAILHTPAAKKEEAIMTEKAIDILKFLGLESLKNELCINLPHGYQRTIGIGIALATQPKLLLLDEPMTGMNPQETQEVMGCIKKIRDMGITVVIVEHDMKAIMGLCNRIVVLNYGKKIAEGLPEEITMNKQVIEAYLGKEEELG